MSGSRFPFPDPLTNATTLARQKYYGVNGTPAAFVNGKTVDDAGGPAGVAVQRFTHSTPPRLNPRVGWHIL